MGIIRWIAFLTMLIWPEETAIKFRFEDEDDRHTNKESLTYHFNNSRATMKNYSRTAFRQLGLTTRPHPFFVSNLFHVGSYYKTLKRDPTLSKGDVACLISTWDERYMIRYALESSKDFVRRYIIIDKDGSTVSYIKKCQDVWNLDIEIHIKPELNLKESWAFGLKRITEPWILIQDGDEVFHTDGPRDINSLRKFMDRPNILLCAPMVHPYKFNCRIKPRVQAHIRDRKLPFFNVQKYGPYPKVLRNLVIKKEKNYAHPCLSPPTLYALA